MALLLPVEVGWRRGTSYHARSKNRSAQPSSIARDLEKRAEMRGSARLQIQGVKPCREALRRFQSGVRAAQRLQ